MFLDAVLGLDPSHRGPRVDCGAGHRAAFVGYRAKHLDTVLGPLTLRRAWYPCADWGGGLAPLDVAGASLSPGLRRMVARVARTGPFARARDEGSASGWPTSITAPSRPCSVRPGRCPSGPGRRPTSGRALGYFEVDRERMRYARFRAMGLFVGSGAVEAGCRAVIHQRLKLSGMRWSVRGAEAIMSLRCQAASGRWDDVWKWLPDQTDAA